MKFRSVQSIVIAVLAMLPLTGLAIGDFSPVSIAGASFHKTITGGTGGLAQSGEFITLFDPVTDQFKTFAGKGLSDLTGTYSYLKTGDHTATITYTIQGQNGPLVSVEQVVFDSPFSGAYLVTVEGVGTQDVSFTCRVPVATTPTEWKFDTFYPWVWNQGSGWEYHLPTNGGLWIYHETTKNWLLQQ